MLSATVADQPGPLAWLCLIGALMLVGVAWLAVTEHFAEKDRRAWREQVRREAEERSERLRRGG